MVVDIICFSWAKSIRGQHMPNIPINDPINYIGAVLIIVGLFLILTGLDLIRFEKIKVKPRVLTTVIGGILLLFGIGLLMYNSDINGESLEPTITPSSSIIALITTHGNHVTAGNDEPYWNWELRGEANNISDWERFRPICLENGNAAFITYHDRFVTAMDDSPKPGGGSWDWIIQAETIAQDAFEEFTIFDVDTNQPMTCQEFVEVLHSRGSVRIALKTRHGRFVTAMDDSPKPDGSGNWNWELRNETFTLQASEIFTATLLSP
jgi:hypothetical protein